MIRPMVECAGRFLKSSQILLNKSAKLFKIPSLRKEDQQKHTLTAAKRSVEADAA